MSQDETRASHTAELVSQAQGVRYLASMHGCDRRKLELRLLDLQALGTALYMTLAQLPTLLVLDCGKHPESPVSACITAAACAPYLD